MRCIVLFFFKLSLNIISKQLVSSRNNALLNSDIIILGNIELFTKYININSLIKTKNFLKINKTTFGHFYSFKSIQLKNIKFPLYANTFESWDALLEYFNEVNINYKLIKLVNLFFRIHLDLKNGLNFFLFLEFFFIFNFFFKFYEFIYF